MKTYNSKSNAVRAMNTFSQKVQRYLVGAELKEVEAGFEINFTMQADAPAEVLATIEKFNVIVEKEATVCGEFTYCPHCGVHLTNGVTDFCTQSEIAGRGYPEAAIEHEFLCLGCDTEFGDFIGIPVAKVKAAPLTEGLKIQKDRAEKNGVKRPSEGGKCAQLWSLFEAMYAEKGIVPTPKPAKEQSAALGLDPTTTTVQLYRWREFMGFKGK